MTQKTSKPLKLIMLLGFIGMATGATLLALAVTEFSPTEIPYKVPAGLLTFAAGFSVWLFGRFCQWWSHE